MVDTLTRLRCATKRGFQIVVHGQDLIKEAADEIERLRDALIQAEGKARLGADAMQPDKRGQSIAKGFLVVADYCRDAINPTSGERTQEGENE